MMKKHGIQKIAYNFQNTVLTKGTTLMLSHEFTQKYPEFSKEFWEKCDKVRNSKEYKAKAEEFYKKYQ